MWSSKMAAQWRPTDVALNAGNVDFLSTRSPCQIGQCGSNMSGEDIDTQSFMEHSILAIFEDSTVSSEDTRQVEEESETLLSALTQMLECVEDDVSNALSPFDTLPDTKLLRCEELGNSKTTDELAFSTKLRPRAKNHAGKKDESKAVRLHPVLKQQSQILFQGPHKKADHEVNVFTSSSLVNLVKLMHPYCLKMRVEEEGRGHKSTAGPSLSPGDKRQKNSNIFSQGEVWRYEKPTEDSDEDINVVSDDDDTLLKETDDHKKLTGTKDSSPVLKSALLNGKSSRGLFPRAKKRVSFGPIQVTSFDQSVEAEFDETIPSVVSADTPKGASGPVIVVPTAASISVEISDKAEDLLPKGKVKAKTLSLQEYRLLRQKRQPLLEQKGSDTTNWPSVPHPPKELTAILCSYGQRQNLCEMKSSPHLIKKSRNSTYPLQGASCKTSCYPPRSVEEKPLFAVRHRRLRTLQIEPKHISCDTSKFNDKHIDKGATRMKRPLKNLPLLSTDPPNPVIIRLPVHQTHTRTNSHSSSESSVEHSVAASQIQLPTVEPHPSQEVGNQVPITLRTKSSSECRKPQNLILAPKISQSVSLDPVISGQAQKVTEALKEDPQRSAPEKPQSSHQHTSSHQSAAAESGIEACDLTSLLEQFEEKQAEKGDPAIFSNVLPSNLHDDAERTSPLMLVPKSTVNNLECQIALEHVLPEPSGTEVILDSQEVVRVRLKPPPSKGIQIIDPRPLPSRKNNVLAPGAPPHIHSSVSADHNYCMPVEYLHPRTPPPFLKNTREEEPSSFVECNQASIMKSDPPIKADEKYLSASSTCTHLAPTCSPLTPPPSPPSRGREKRRYTRRSPLSDNFHSSSSSSSASRSPKRRRSRHERSGSRSWSSSPSRSVSRSPPRRRKLPCTRLRHNRSRSRSWSNSRSPSPSSPSFCARRGNAYRESCKLKREQKARLQKLKAIDERRVVYIGRIRRSMTHDELRERFSHFGEVECVSLHFRDKGDHYGFVTFYHTDDAFAAIDNGGKLRRPDELPFDICFGGRRQFCNSDYADLDAKVDADPSPAKSRFEELDFDSLLKQAQRGLR